MPTRKELANAVRALAMDAVQKAKSGHPGAPMGMADMAEVLWNDFMVHNPANPGWFNRDRFVLSNGHASMLLYSVLHLSGYDLSIEDLKNFRQLNSKTPGHPEYGVTPGVETTTGPLGQGIANAVGMAIAEKILAQTYNREGFPLVDHFTYVFMGDGCLMEGISHEVSSLAGTLGLGKLIVFWDNNGISIDGQVQGWFSEDVVARYKAYGWHVEEVDGHDGEAIKKAVAKARKVLDKPSLIACKTTIAFGAPTKAGSEKSHGSPLGEEEIEGARKLLGWKYPPFEIPEEIRQGWDARLSGQQAEKKWNKLYDDYKKSFPAEADEFEKRMSGELSPEFRLKMYDFALQAQKDGGSEASRKSSQNTINLAAPLIPAMLGGSADLAGSILTHWNDAKDISKENFAGNFLYYGVREFGMGAIMNGIALHGGFIPFSGTFLVFSDYAKNAIRLSAMMHKRVIWVLTHDSIGVGEDGPTHQPVEQVSALRAIPGVHVWRPCDKVETVAAWVNSIRNSKATSCMALSRQNLPVMPRDKTVMTELTMQQNPSEAEVLMKTIRRGGYILRECKGGEPEAILIATGSEVSLAVEAAEVLEGKGVKVRVVSMPCAELFDQQDITWRSKVLPSCVRARVAVEAAAEDYWRKYVGLDGAVVGMHSFGQSAPANVLMNYFGFTVDNVVKTVERVMNQLKA